MPKYIDAGQAAEIIGAQLGVPLSEMVDIMGNVPAVDVAPVVHAEWKYYNKQGIAVCENCSFGLSLDEDFGRAIACPNCGAKMDGGTK